MDIYQTVDHLLRDSGIVTLVDKALYQSPGRASCRVKQSQRGLTACVDVCRIIGNAPNWFANAISRPVRVVSPAMATILFTLGIPLIVVEASSEPTGVGTYHRYRVGMGSVAFPLFRMALRPFAAVRI